MSIREQAGLALALAEKATPGPWAAAEGKWAGRPGWDVLVEDVSRTEGLKGYAVADCGPTTNADSHRDAAFIAAARADVPALARFVLRVTGSEMRERVRLRIVEHLRATDPALAVRVAATFGDTAGSNIADAIMALLLGDES